MAKDKKKKSKKEEDEQMQKKLKFDLHPETKKSVLGVIFFAIAAVFMMSYFQIAGVAGQYIYRVLNALLGVGYFVVPLALIMIAIGFFRSLKTDIYFTSVFGGVLFLVSVLGAIDVLYNKYGAGVTGTGSYIAGYIGFFIAYPFSHFFGFWVSILIFLLGALIAISIAFNVPLFSKRKEDEQEDESLHTIEDFEKETNYIEEQEDEEEYEDDKKEGEDEEEEKSQKNKSKKNTTKQSAGSKKLADFIVETHQSSYQIPPLDLLESDSSRPSSGDVDAYALVIQKTLKHFGIDVEMGEINVGPTVTQYTLKPAQGIKLARIVALHNDLSLSLAAHPLRIEAPIPGRSLVGIEVPNKVVAVVKLKDLLDSPAFEQAPPLTIALGRDVSGNPQYADIEKMPHLLIAGTTGAGKSVCVHSILTSLLYKNFPQMLKLLIIDPKRVELSMYNNIPHLLAPVIVDRSKALGALRWAVKEMERRYEFLSRFKVRNISSYNAQIAKGKSEESILPYIIIVVDELADLMSTSSKEVEASIVRLAQMSRAVGIHLIISTQRPSVEVITGLIKANIPCRIAFQVSSLIDSRTILDMSGAEKLIGNGDMLYLPPDMSKPRRIQGAFVSEKEVKKVTDYIISNALDQEAEQEAGLVSDDITTGERKKQDMVEMPINFDEHTENSDDDALFEQAKIIIVQAKKASTSLLQRRLKLGYARAARIIDMLEEQGCVGPADGAKPREVYLEQEEQQNDEII